MPEHPVYPLGARVGSLTAQAAAWTRLDEGIAVAVGNGDAHVTPPAANAIASGQMVLTMGTSTCRVMNGEKLAEVAGMCGWWMAGLPLYRALVGSAAFGTRVIIDAS